LRPVKNSRLEEAVKLFCNQAIASKIPLTGTMIQEKALSFAEKMELTDFKASNGWLNRFIKRTGLSFKKICGESASVQKKSLREPFPRKQLKKSDELRRSPTFAE
jgi:hypothetical protein